MKQLFFNLLYLDLWSAISKEQTVLWIVHSVRISGILISIHIRTILDYNFLKNNFYHAQSMLVVLLSSEIQHMLKKDNI